jgi:AraC-like DNA-binding protein
MGAGSGLKATDVFSPGVNDLSFLAVIELLELDPGLDGRVERHAARDVRVRPHRHAEVEVNLVLRGTATYLLGEQRYELTPGTVTWLFPAQEHILVNRSSDHEVYWAVFRPRLVARLAREPHLEPLLAKNPAGQFSRHLTAGSARRLQALFEEVREAETRDGAVANTGLAYLLTMACRMFLDAGDIVDGVHVHPAVRGVIRHLRAEPGGDDLAALALGVGLSPSHLSRLFTAETGISLTRYRNQQRVQRFLLNYGDDTATTLLDAALNAGFGSYAQFYRVVREETGRGPATLRSRHGRRRLHQ